MIIALTIHGTYIFSTSDTNFVTLLSFSSCSKRQVFPSFSTTVVGEILLVPRLPPPRVFLFCITLFVFVSVYLVESPWCLVDYNFLIFLVYLCVFAFGISVFVFLYFFVFLYIWWNHPGAVDYKFLTLPQLLVAATLLPACLRWTMLNKNKK